jgi:S-adenosylmethionine hydrolase
VDQQPALRVAGPGGAHGAVLATTFADVAPGGLLVHLDAAGRVAVAVNRGSAAAALGAGTGAQVRISPGG